MLNSKRVSTSITFDIATGAVESRDSFTYAGPWALCDEADPKADPPKPAEQAALPGVVSDADKKRADAAEAELATVKKANAERDAKAKAKKAEADGKLKDELTTTAAKLAEATEKAEKLEKAARDRVEGNIAKLSKEDQADIAEIKDDLSLSKLEALVERRIAAAAPKPEIDKDGKPKPAAKTPPPTPGVQSHSPKPPEGHELHAETIETLADLYAQPRLYETGKHLGVDSTGRFGWGRSDDLKTTTTNFMHLLRSVAAQPVGSISDDELTSRVFKKN